MKLNDISNNVNNYIFSIQPHKYIKWAESFGKLCDVFSEISSKINIQYLSMIHSFIFLYMTVIVLWRNYKCYVAHLDNWNLFYNLKNQIRWYDYELKNFIYNKIYIERFQLIPSILNLSFIYEIIEKWYCSLHLLFYMGELIPIFSLVVKNWDLWFFDNLK